MPEPDMSIWTGRVDAADGPRALRWHQMVKPLTPGCHSGVALIGFACDEGVRRNGGRVGAKDGPQAIRQSLANLSWYQTHPVHDAGDVRCDDGNLEASQTQLAEIVGRVRSANHRPIVLGGGHETAWGTFQGVLAASPSATVGVINIDAHLDLRADPIPNSGTSFRQIADWSRNNGRPFRYFCLGVSLPSNTVALAIRAKDLGAVWRLDQELHPWELAGPLAAVTEFAASVDLIHLSIDLDVLPAAVMPAVSAPASRGVPLESVEAIVSAVKATGKMAAVDIVELNPAYDIDNRGVRLAARLVWEIAREWSITGEDADESDSF